MHTCTKVFKLCSLKLHETLERQDTSWLVLTDLFNDSKSDGKKTVEVGSNVLIFIVDIPKAMYHVVKNFFMEIFVTIRSMTKQSDILKSFVNDCCHFVDMEYVLNSFGPASYSTIMWFSRKDGYELIFGVVFKEGRGWDERLGVVLLAASSPLIKQLIYAKIWIGSATVNIWFLSVLVMFLLWIQTWLIFELLRVLKVRFNRCHQISIKMWKMKLGGWMKHSLR